MQAGLFWGIPRKPGVRLVGAGYLHPAMRLSGPGYGATAMQGDGSYKEVPVFSPRWVRRRRRGYTPPVNLLTATAQAITGTTGLNRFPTDWGVVGSTLNVQREFLNTGNEDGMRCADLRIFATGNTVAGIYRISFDFGPGTTTGRPASKDELYRWLLAVRVLAGTLPGLIVLRRGERNNGALLLTREQVITPGKPTDSLPSCLRQFRGVIERADTTALTVELAFNIPANATFDVTLRVGGPAVYLGDPEPLEPGGLLIEPEKLNGVRNTRGEGIIPSTDGAAVNLPNLWTLPNKNSGLTLGISQATYGEMTGVRVRYSGITKAGAGNETIEFEQRGGAMPIVAGEARVNRFFYRLADGALPLGLSFYSRTLGFRANGSLPDNTNLRLDPPDLELRESVQPYSPIADIGAGAYGTFGMNTSTFPSETPVDFTLDLFWPTSEPATATPTSPILPPIGAPASTFRPADRLRLRFSNLRDVLGDLRQGTIIARWNDRIGGAPAINRTIFALSNGGTGARLMGFIVGGGGTAAGRVNGLNIPTVPGHRPSDLNAYAFTWGGTRAGQALNGNSVWLDLPADTLKVAEDYSAGLEVFSAWSGGNSAPHEAELLSFDFLPYRVEAAELVALATP